ncbi:MAG TPA: phosphohistidine phosphatase SixA [Cyclobacteriaceae bacterium]|nr:phosphohistidine phosphatase SixA [Cyclobacteriaceae bacterium]HNP06860.1 phosphohistidine phosphatase SixA [Cyclobacteriaceae bacterium]HRK55328.1 phosphohistidine phosphatase SixA [Cyclobacteriaceae bacterium]
MVRWLYLMRHAQSADKQHSQHDKDRELTATGMREAATIGHFLKKNNYDVDLIISSAARRAESTATVIHGILNLQSEITINEELYEASVRNLMETVTHLDDDFKNILIIGHNPYISYFAEHLTKAEIGNMETAGLVSIRFEISKWEEATEDIGSFENYIHPSIIE